MSWIVNSNMKTCGTCRKWCGQRMPNDPWANNLVIESPETRGKCLGGGFNQLNMQANSRCQQWEPQYPKK